jgi:hypothetical protein
MAESYTSHNLLPSQSSTAMARSKTWYSDFIPNFYSYPIFLPNKREYSPSPLVLEAKKEKDKKIKVYQSEDDTNISE